MKKYFSYTRSAWMALLMIFFMASCSKDKTEPNGNSNGNHSSFSINNSAVSSDDEGKTVIRITFSGLDDISYLQIRKSGSSLFSDQVAKNELSNSYDYVYHVQDEDPNTIKLVFNVKYTDGSESKFITVSVQNKKGKGGVVTRSQLLVKRITRIARVTGSAMPGEGLINPNNTASAWDVGGTDLGIIWEADPGNYGVFFGDTFGNDFAPNQSSPGPNGSRWRSNVLGYSKSFDLDNGLFFDYMITGTNGTAKEVLPGATTGSTSSIPTAAIRVNGVDYAHCFKVKSWNPDLSTEYSTVYKSTDGGKNWTRVDNVTFSSDSKFALVGYWKKDGYVYMVGTPTYRSRPAYLARFKEEDIENLENYEYWSASSQQWIKGDESRATAIIEGTVGELSLIYNTTYKKWIIAYFNGAEYNITMRIADDITGPWDTKFVLATGQQYPQLYGSYFHPLSAEGDNLYFTMSMWLPYNVFLMKVELSDE